MSKNQNRLTRPPTFGSQTRPPPPPRARWKPDDVGQPVTSAAYNDPLASSVQPAELRERTPWLLAFLCFLIPALPSLRGSSRTA